MNKTNRKILVWKNNAVSDFKKETSIEQNNANINCKQNSIVILIPDNNYGSAKRTIYTK